MKAITIWQPWASLLASGGKMFETRSWSTRYRGPIAIHASKKDPRAIMRDLEGPTLDLMRQCIGRDLGRLPTGAIIATGSLVHIYAITRTDEGVVGIPVKPDDTLDLNAPRVHPTIRERSFGDWTPGRYAWEFADVRPLLKPVPISGKQGLWDFYPR